MEAGKFVSEIFQDIDGGYSAKRTAFFVFVALFCIVSVCEFLHAFPEKDLTYAQGVLDRCVDLIKWLGGFIVGERAGLFAPRRQGDQDHG